MTAGHRYPPLCRIQSQLCPAILCMETLKFKYRHLPGSYTADVISKCTQHTSRGDTPPHAPCPGDTPISHPASHSLLPPLLVRKLRAGAVTFISCVDSFEHLPDIQLLPKSDSGDLLGHRLSICAGNRGTNWPRRDTHESEKRFC